MTDEATAAQLKEAHEAMADTPEAAAAKMTAHLDDVRCKPTDPSEQREEYEKIAARISVGKASQDDAVQAILQLCRDNERLAVICGKRVAERDTALARMAELNATLTRAWEMGRDNAADLAHRVAEGYDAGGDKAIACSLYLTIGNIRALTTPADLAQRLGVQDE